MFVTNRIAFCASLIGFGIVFVSFITLCQMSYRAKNYYKAAVVEYHPFQYPAGTPSETILMENVKRYKKIVVDNKQNLDIIVFPECTLTIAAVIKTRLAMLNYSTIVPNPSDVVDVCESQMNFPHFFTYLACTAKEAKVYVVVNLIEQQLCYDKSYDGEFRQCSKDGWNFYNTDVVFDRNGRVVARYRKYNLFGEEGMNRTVFPDISIFKSDFGVTFGLFTCFDILFRKPAIDLIKVYGIKHIIYPTMWFSQLPFLTALQSQSQWAYEMNAVMLSAGANNYEKGSGGTGIYKGKFGAIIFDYSEDGHSKVYMADVPIDMPDTLDSENDEDDVDELAKKMDKFHLKIENLTDYSMQYINPKQMVVDTVFCHQNLLCCHFYIKREMNEFIEGGSQHYYYYMTVYTGVRSFDNVAKGGIEICGIIACTNNTRESCGNRFPIYGDIQWPVTFTNISIKANFSVQDNKIQYPNSLLSSIRPLPADSIEWKHSMFERGTIIERTINLKKPQNRLLTFAIYGRDFSKDSNLMD